MTQLKTLLTETAKRIQPRDDLLAQILRKAQRKHQARRLTTMLVAIALGLSGTTFLVIERMAGQSAVPMATRTPNATATNAAEVPIAAADVNAPGDLVAGYGALWVETGQDSIVELDANNGSTAGSVQLNANDSPALQTTGSLAAGFNSIWWLGKDSVYRVAPDSLSVTARITVPDAAFVAVGANAVWVATGGMRPSIERLDPDTNQLVASLPLTSPIKSLAVDDTGSLWVVPASENSTIERINPTASTQPESLAVPAQTSQIAFAGKFLWAITNFYPNKGLIAISDQLEIVQQIPIDGAIQGLVGDSRSLWLNSNGLPIEIDPSTGTILESPTEPQPGFRDASIAITGQSVWLAVPGKDRVQRFTADSAQS